jgi:translation initiation factor IF-1
VVDIAAAAAHAKTVGRPTQITAGCGTSNVPRPSSFLSEQNRNNLPKEDAIEVMGKVVEKFKAGMFSIELDVGTTVLATMAGRLRRNRIKVMNGDRVSLELSPYDLTRGRITYRHK